MSSLTVFAGSAGCTAIINPAVATSVIGVKSVTGSYGFLLTRCGLMHKVLIVAIGRRARGCLPGAQGAGARAIVDDDLLPHRFGKFLGDRPRYDIVAASG